MKKLLLILLCVPLLFSCGDKSEKGKWNTNDIDRCKKEGIEILGQAPEEYWSKYNTTLESVVDCHCKTLEKVLESYSIFEQLTPDDLRDDYDYEWRDCLK